MKKILFSFLTATLICSTISCKKTTESVVDCLAESFLVKIKTEVDPSNSKVFHFTASYSGTNDVTTVFWDYGDGKTETISGTTVSHTYSTVGVYTVKAKINISHGKGTCSPEPTESISVN